MQLLFSSPCTVNLFLTLPLSVSRVFHLLFDLTQNDYIKCFAKAAYMKVASLYHSPSLPHF